MKIFVFGSNLKGVHGAGGAKHALEHYGAKWGQGVGRQGISYAIPTKDHTLSTLPLAQIKPYVDAFIQYAKDNPNLYFQLTAIGCGLAGYSPKDIAPMFKDAPENVLQPPEFQAINR